MEVEKANFPVTLMCRVLEVSRSGYDHDQGAFPRLPQVWVESRSSHSRQPRRSLFDQPTAIQLNHAPALISLTD